MGTFDTVNVQCPECGTKVGIQSKSGVCAFFDYGLEDSDIPNEILRDIVANIHRCYKCNITFKIELVEKVVLFPKVVLVGISGEDIKCSCPPDTLLNIETMTCQKCGKSRL